ncbi:MAG: hypothetical protein E7279_06040 [Lachnospiraceae bacterium]|nr:hypothetical protein [Lachnospiraceae bacterium]
MVLMDKIKRILAIIAIILLVGMYATTLVIALIGGPNLMTYLGISIAATLIIPILLFCGIEMAKKIKEKKEDNNNMFS